MNIKHIAAAAAVSLVLVGCQAGGGTGNNTNEGAEGTQNHPVEQTRYENNTGDGMTGDRNHNMMRDSERNQDRDGTRSNNMTNQNEDGTRNNNMNNETNGANNQGKYEVAEEAADRITDEVEVIDGAYVLTTNNNAYVAANLDTDAGNRENGTTTDGGEVTDEVKQEISEIVKSVDNNIDNVYVSTNPDFFDLANNYNNDLNDGRPVEGFFSQIGNMVERLFPQNR